MDPEVAAEIVEINVHARLDELRVAFGVAALLTAAVLFFTGAIPLRAPGTGSTRLAEPSAGLDPASDRGRPKPTRRRS